MIVIDSKEAQKQPKVIEGFRKAKVKYRIMPLEVGDFTNDKQTFIAERKGMSDFWNSMVDGRIDDQPIRMNEIYSKNRYMFIESGAFSYQSKTKHSTSWCYSKYGEIENWGVHVREYVNYIDLARKLNSLDIYLGTEKVVREKRIKYRGVPDNVKLVMGVRGVGRKKAEAMLKECGTPFRVFNDIVNNRGSKCAMAYGLKQYGTILTKYKNILTQK